MENVNVILPSVCYSVEKIVGISVGQENLKCFKVQWAPSWVTEVNLVGCDKLIAQFVEDQEKSKKEREIETLSCPIKVEDDEDDTVRVSYEGTSQNDTQTPSSLGAQSVILNPGSIPQTDESINQENYRYQETPEENYLDSRDHDIPYDKDAETDPTALYEGVDIDISEACIDRVTMSDELKINTSLNYTAAKSKTEYTSFDTRKGLNIIESQSKSWNNEGKLLRKSSEFNGESCGPSHCSSTFVPPTIRDIPIPPFTTFNQFQAPYYDGTFAYQRFVQPIGAERLSSTSTSRSYEKPAFLKKMLLKEKKGMKKVYGCKICLLTFTRKKGLEEHVRTHSGVSPVKKTFQCSVCQKEFNRKDQCRQHERCHSDERPYTCEICGRKFKDASNFKVHVQRKHTMERPHQCHLCTKSFTTTSDLKKHVRIHTGERPYKCSFCSMRFKTNSQMQGHQRRCTTKSTPT